MCAKVLKKARDAHCYPEVVQRVQNQLDLIIARRNLEEDELTDIREYLKQSCWDFAREAVRGDGRAITIFNRSEGTLTPACIALDPPLETLRVVHDRDEFLSIFELVGERMLVSSLRAVIGMSDPEVGASPAFACLTADEQACIAAVRYMSDQGNPGLLCVQEPTPTQAARFIEALTMLETLCAKDEDDDGSRSPTSKKGSPRGYSPRD